MALVQVVEAPLSSTWASAALVLRGGSESWKRRPRRLVDGRQPYGCESVPKPYPENGKIGARCVQVTSFVIGPASFCEAESGQLSRACPHRWAGQHVPKGGPAAHKNPLERAWSRHRGLFCALSKYLGIFPCVSPGPSRRGRRSCTTQLRCSRPKGWAPWNLSRKHLAVRLVALSRGSFTLDTVSSGYALPRLGPRV